MEQTEMSQTSEFDSVSKALVQLRKGETDLDIVCNQIILLAEKVKWKMVKPWLENQFENDLISSHDFRAIMDILKGIMIEDTSSTDMPIINPQQQTLPTVQLPAVATPDHYPAQLTQSLPTGIGEDTPLEVPEDEENIPSLIPTIVIGIIAVVSILILTIYLSRNHLEQLSSGSGSPVHNSEEPISNTVTNNSPHHSTQKDSAVIPATQFEAQSIAPPQNQPLTNIENGQVAPSKSEFENIPSAKLIDKLNVGLKEELNPEKANLLSEMFYHLNSREEVIEETRTLRQRLSSLLLEKAQEARQNGNTDVADLYVELALNVKTHRASI